MCLQISEIDSLSSMAQLWKQLKGTLSTKLAYQKSINIVHGLTARMTNIGATFAI